MKGKIRSPQYRKKGLIARKQKAATQDRNKGQIEIVYVESIRKQGIPSTFTDTGSAITWRMKAIEIRTGEQLENIGREVIRCLQSKLKLVWGMPPLQGQKFAARKTTSLCEEDCKPSSSRPTTPAQGGEGLYANGLSGM